MSPGLYIRGSSQVPSVRAKGKFHMPSVRAASLTFILIVLLDLCVSAALAESDGGAVPSEQAYTSANDVASSSLAPEDTPDLTAGPAVSTARSACFVVSIGRQHCWLCQGGKLVSLGRALRPR
jgi:hypothetical protein